ncbi:MAG TPA: Mrp/NBP35 family ATP-binding protein [Candidatus Cloacimonas sp.]|jgi:Mrp family chromosome partitioning ATPase|nr:MAG: Septum site-determining protein MinD [Candidatus Cloacimonetes bacterium ADurb.Bin089]HPB18551.1 Mrp/NBP35 family ATP-binding protein [Candidatus Cloacimonas sp.]
MDATQDKAIQTNLAKIHHRIVVLSGKGGVGKSFIATNLAYGLALQGKTVGLLDVDIHGPSIAKLTNIEGRNIPIDPETGKPTPIPVLSNLYVLTLASILDSESSAVIWRGPMKLALIRQFFSDFEWKELDYLIVDCPPGTGDEPLTVIQTLEKVDGIVIVTTPQDLAILDVKKTVDFADKLSVPILGVVENMKFFRCPHCGNITNIFNGNQLEALIVEHSLDVLAELEMDPDISKSADEGKPYIYFYNKNVAAGALMAAVLKIMGKIEDGDNPEM